MIAAAVLEAMLKAGCSAEQLVAVVRADEEANAERLADKREKNRIRQRNHRERNAMSRVTECDMRDERDTPSSSPIPLVPPSQTLPPIIPQTPSPSAAPRRATRLADNWVLPSSWGKWALDQGYHEAAVRIEAEKFANYWQSKAGKDATKLDWEKTWRNWMHSVQKAVRASGAPPPKPLTAFQQRHQNAMDAIDRKLGIKPNDDFTGKHFDLDTADWRAH